MKEIKKLMIINDPPETNMVMVKFSPSPLPPEVVINAMQAQNVRISLWDKDQFRLVTHKDIDQEDIERLIWTMHHLPTNR